MNYTEAHVHHLAKKAHAYKSRLEEHLGSQASVVERGLNLLVIGAGAWLGGMVEGKTGGGTVAHVPINLLAGLVFNGAGFFGEKVFGAYAPHLNQFGNGFNASWVAAKGFTFGQTWQQTGKLFGGQPVVALPAAHPAAVAAPKVSGAEMDSIIDRMSEVAAQHGR